MIKVENLSKYFDNFCAVNQISFTVDAGEVLGFLGPNGAGKSTSMKMLTGFLQPTSGTISINGHVLPKEALAAQKEIGYLPEGAPAYADMTVAASLSFIGKSRGYSGAELQSRIDHVVAKVELDSVMHKRIETLSKGYRRRLGLAQALLHDPKILILDEPTDGLDPNQKHQVRELIRNLAKDKIVIVSTHILEEVSAVCTRAMILAGGSIVFDGTPEELAAKSDYHNAVVVRLNRVPEALLDSIKALPEVRELEQHENEQFIVLPKDGQNILAQVNRLLHASDCQVEELHVEVGRLDDVFRKVTLNQQDQRQHEAV
ncbi:MAG: ABC transporter ATP-binding protein [Oleiphilaceae bacterium]|nr:ABC transporter ATP-binding protein [Oleiphilaceae bacterium]